MALRLAETEKAKEDVEARMEDGMQDPLAHRLAARIKELFSL